MPILSPVLPVALAVAAALAPQGTDREAFAAALPKMRALAAASDWEGLCAAYAPFAGLRARVDANRDEVDDVLLALPDMLGSPPQTPENPGARGLVADLLGADAVAAVHYREYLDRGTREVWAHKSSFVGYLAFLALRRDDLAAAKELLNEWMAAIRRMRPQAESWEYAHPERLLAAVTQLQTAPADPWRRLAFLREYRACVHSPGQQSVWHVLRELQRLAAGEAAKADHVLALALRCEDVMSWPKIDHVVHERALPAARTCVDDGLVAHAGKRTDVADPWTPLQQIGMVLRRAGDDARAVIAFDALVAGGKAVQAPLLVHEALVQAAECKLALGRHADALTDLERSEREFPFQSGCGTCDMGEQARIAALRTKIQTAAAGKAK
jgi:hypothetical protein